MDIDRLHALWAQPDMRRLLWDDIVISRDRAADEVARGFENAARYGIGYWIIESQKKDDLLGFCGFRLIDQGPDIESMYGLERACWGKGLATEASRAVLAWLWASTSYQRVFARTDPPNRKSIEVMQRLGMRLDSDSTHANQLCSTEELLIKERRNGLVTGTARYTPNPASVPVACAIAMLQQLSHPCRGVS